MKKLFGFILILMCIMQFSNSYAADSIADYNVVPLPKSIVMQKGEPFVMSNTTNVVYPEGNDLMKRNAEFLVEYVKKSTGLTLTVTTKPQKKASNIILSLDKKAVGTEAYKIVVTKKSAVISGLTPNGVFYGIQTFRKSLPILSTAADVALPAATVTDSPRFSYRGMMLDCGRHFFPVDVVKEYIDLLALHGMNTFHWHLTEDQGWRIEIKKYPELTKIGSVRKHTVIGHNSPVYDDTPYGGFYTQEQAKEIVAYAKERYITVIPEIDMPGHMLGALASYPELGCTGGPYEVSPSWGVFDDILCAGKEKTFKFIEDVLDELIEIFPSEYIHLGGDEAPKTCWEKCPNCQQRIKDEHIVGDEKQSAEAKLQGYFVKRIEKYLNSKGRKIIGWDEILDADVNQSATIMSWRGMEGGLRASEMGHDVIMSPTTYAYFDYYQTKADTKSILLIGGYLPLSKVYSFEPVPATLSDNAKKHIFGVQANLWTEYLTCKGLVEYQVLPRMAAISEIQWINSDKKNYDNFVTRLPHLIDLYKLYGLTVAQYE
jgi:hexosaminidase